MCVFLRYWAGLQVGPDQEMLMEGADRLQRVAMQAHEIARRTSILRITNGADDEDVDVAGEWSVEVGVAPEDFTKGLLDKKGETKTYDLSFAVVR